MYRPSAGRKPGTASPNAEARKASLIGAEPQSQPAIKEPVPRLRRISRNSPTSPPGSPSGLATDAYTTVVGYTVRTKAGVVGRLPPSSEPFAVVIAASLM